MITLNLLYVYLKFKIAEIKQVIAAVERGIVRQSKDEPQKLVFVENGRNIRYTLARLLVRKFYSRAPAHILDQANREYEMLILADQMRSGSIYKALAGALKYTTGNGIPEVYREGRPYSCMVKNWHKLDLYTDNEVGLVHGQGVLDFYGEPKHFAYRALYWQQIKRLDRVYLSVAEFPEYLTADYTVVWDNNHEIRKNLMLVLRDWLQARDGQFIDIHDDNVVVIQEPRHIPYLDSFFYVVWDGRRWTLHSTWTSVRPGYLRAYEPKSPECPSLDQAAAYCRNCGERGMHALMPASSKDSNGHSVHICTECMKNPYCDNCGLVRGLCNC